MGHETDAVMGGGRAGPDVDVDDATRGSAEDIIVREAGSAGTAGGRADDASSQLSSHNHIITRESNMYIKFRQLQARGSSLSKSPVPLTQRRRKPFFHLQPAPFHLYSSRGFPLSRVSNFHFSSQRSASAFIQHWWLFVDKTRLIE